MLYEKHFKNPEKVQQLQKQLQNLARITGSIKLMEICGTHTMAIARTGLKSILPPDIHLISGPGCPVCVTPAGVIDSILTLSQQPGITIASYGDLLRVPGSVRGDSLLRRRALGASVEAVYSPMDVLKMAADHPDRQFIFLGVGFETTAPGTAACILEASRMGLKNFSVLSLLKTTEPALRTLAASDDFSVNGFLCPGHVAAITGTHIFKFLPEEYGLGAVVSGFEAADLLYSVYVLVKMLADHAPCLKNEYIRLVKPEGNPAAQKLISRVFTPCISHWRGLGIVEHSGLAIREDYAQYDAAKRFDFQMSAETSIPGCLCPQVIRGAASPSQCPLFKTVCTPSDPVGPCMVSGEGACAAAYRYQI